MSNKFQRLAIQVAKDDSKKEYYINRKFNIRETKSLVLAGFREELRTYEDARRYKNWNKNIEF
jgi:hypothetical protein